MVNNHSAFLDFDNNKIKLTEKRQKELFGSRNSIREKIRTFMKEEKPNEVGPKFDGQGSIPMGTAINPIPIIEGRNTFIEYDLDDGVYFIVPNSSKERKTIQTYHTWIVNAIDGHTGTPPIDKSTCVRVVFADGHHIDLPIYYLVEGSNPELAHKAKGWIKSDPRAFSQWFNGFADKNPQLRRIVRYLKAWKNYRETNNTSLSLPSGFALTILATNNFKPDERDDIAFLNTVSAIHQTLENRFVCWRPTIPVEDVFEDFSDTQESQFMDALSRLIENCKKAGKETNYRTSSEYLRKEFGDRFPLGKDENVDDKKNRIVAGIASTIAPRPYSSDF